MHRRTLILIAVPVVTLIAAGAAVTSFVRGGGEGGLLGLGFTAVERWCGTQLEAIANDWLRPELSFSRLELELPRTLILRDVRLAESGTTCIAVDELRIILKERPKKGQPLVIEDVQLDKPVVSLVTRPDGSIVGFSPFVDGTGERSGDGGSTKTSDVFAIRKFTIDQGVFNWTASDGTAMTLDDLSFDLSNSHTAQPGVYVVQASIERAPILEIDFNGELNIDDPGLAIKKMDTTIDLSSENRNSLPPALQQMLGRYELVGLLKMTTSGQVPFKDAKNAAIDGTLELERAHLLIDRYEVPLDTLTSTFRLQNRTLDIDPLQAAVFGGTLSADCQMALVGDFATQVSVDGRGMKLETAIRTFSEGAQGFTGTTTIRATANMPLRTLPDGLAGGGTINIVDGTLMGDAVFSGLMEDLGRKEVVVGTDQASTEFTLASDHVGMTEVRLVGGSFAARGEGELGYDGHINYRFNAGPLEKLEHELGVVGDVLGAVTDRLVTYQVTGSFRHPEFTTRPLGIGVVPGRE